MILTVKLFARARELAHRPEMEIDVAGAPTAADVIRAVVAIRPALAPIAQYLRVAVNQELVGGEHRVEAGDEVALLPPMSGG